MQSLAIASTSTKEESEFLNIKEFTVTEISNSVKNLLESNFSYVRVKGEISGLKIAASGHGYFNLKDNAAVLCCICWRHVLNKIEFSLNDGLEIVITGKLTAYAGQSRYQLSVENVKPAGLGVMMQILDERKNRLDKEGLFKEIYKKSLPFLPNKIGVITSISGAVIKDIIHRITDRFPLSMLIWSVTVQGNEAAHEVTEAIEGFNNLEAAQKPDLIIIARGGGSIEDLWCFNEEAMVRAAFASIIPIISAIGHETDFTLLDFVADARAPTPTAAAEFAVPVKSDLAYTVNSNFNYLCHKLAQSTRYYGQILNSFENIIRQPSNYIEYLQQRIDDLDFRLKNSSANLFHQKTISIERYNLDYNSVSRIIDNKNLKLNLLSNYFGNLAHNFLKSYNYKLQINDKILNSLDYHNVLKRGFALIKDRDNNLITSALASNSADKLTIEFYDGEIKVEKI